MVAELFLLLLLASLPRLQAPWDALCAALPPAPMFVALCLAAQTAGYAAGAAPYAAADALRPRRAARRKLQPARYACAADLARVARALVGLVAGVMAPMIVAGVGGLEAVGISREGRLPGRARLAVELVFFLVVEDYLNYWLHRALHTPWLYKKVHAVHHEYTAPFALMATYAHPVEVVVLAVPTFAGPALAAPHMFTVLAWQLLRNFEAIDIHSGYELPWSVKALFPAYAGAAHHDYHHYMHSGNFASVFVWCDRLYGTDLGYASFQANKAKAKAKAEAEAEAKAKAKLC